MAAMLGQAKDPSVLGFESRRRAPPSTPTLRHPSNAEHPGTAMLFIDYMLRPENVKRNISTSATRCRSRGSEDVYAALVEPFPQCLVTADDLKADLFFRNGSSKGEQARDTAWTHMKAG